MTRRAPLDEIELLAFLTAPAPLEIEIGGARRSTARRARNFAALYA